ncbi:MAG TPA: FHA domain-containing protein [Gammaproteobacteria bacterium]
MATLIQYKNNVPGVKIAIDSDPFRIGRSENNHLCIDDQLSSRDHALIESLQSQHADSTENYILRDLQSTNGTYVNHSPITSHLLLDGDMIRIGQTFFKFALHDGEEDPAETRIMKKSIIPGVYYTTNKERD